MTVKPHGPRYRTAAASVAALALVLVACDNEDNAAAPNPSTTTMTASPSEKPSSQKPSTDKNEPSTMQGSVQPQTGSAGPKNAEPQGETQLYVTDVRAGSHENFDRVVIELGGTGIPGYFTDITSEPRQQASGYPVEVGGDTAINLMIRGVGLPFETGHEDWPIGQTPGAGAIAGVAHAGVFEGQDQFVIGLNGAPRNYSVQVLQNPTRVVVDVDRP
ncbi:AMIN-like domain-containing (lipo)protein [Corynebacterium tapiri]|uniref:AMIN-like domain-containing protein n=1 Tax=Corynebacterium tapiri TaxID=1448266 RepID=A0A5C4U516_9CORY|nr:hypothetical protein [Corynebacterium tapiri]TNL99256.1 hypothetical protein FHE74_02555 [Corynebacterium tapiri]